MLRGGEQDVDGENCPAQDRRQIRDTGVVRHGHGLLRKGGLRAKLHARPSRPLRFLASFRRAEDPRVSSGADTRHNIGEPH